MSLATVSRLRTRLNATLVMLMMIAVGSARWINARPQAADFFTQAPQDALKAPSKYTDASLVLGDLNAWLVKFVGVTAICAFFAGAYSYFLSGGSEDQMNKGKLQMVGSMIGLFVVLFAERITQIFVDFFAGK